MRILSRYFVARFLGLFATILAGSLATLVIVELLLNLDDMLRVQEGLGGVLRYLALRIPTMYLRPLVPIASFAAAFFALGLASHWLELTAAQAGGLSPRRLAVPIVVTALVLGLASFLVTEGWILDSSRALALGADSSDEGLSFRRGSFWYHRADTIYNIAEADQDSRTLRGVAVFQLTPRGRLKRSIRAEAAELGPDSRWTFRNATIHAFEPGNPESVPTLDRHPEITLEMDTMGDTLMHADARYLSVAMLGEYIRERRATGRPTAEVTTLLHTRLTQPLVVALFALLAIPLGLSVADRRGFGRSAAIGIALIAAFFFVRDVAETLASQSVVPAPIAAWFVVGLFTGIGVWQMARSTA